MLETTSETKSEMASFKTHKYFRNDSCLSPGSWIVNASHSSQFQEIIQKSIELVSIWINLSSITKNKALSDQKGKVWT